MKNFSIILSLITIFNLNLYSDNPLPNIILIFVDDMAYGDASCYGGKLVETKNISRLANQGIQFTQAYSISPVCGPSRVGLMSGTYPGRFGIYGNPDMGAVQIPKDRPILPIQLKKAGYTTGLIGKWNLNNPSWNPMPPENYFDFVENTMVWEGDYWPNSLGHYHGVNDNKYGSTKKNNIWGPTSKGQIYLTDLLSKNACEFIDKNSEKPFFLFLSYNAPHSPLQGKLTHKASLKHIDSEALRLYASMLLSIDEGIGQILDRLESNGISRNTMTIFLSDNGPARTNFKGLPIDWPKNQLLGSTSGLRGHKGNYFEGGIRVPFIISWPEIIPAGQSSNELISSLDIFPTLSEIANISLPEKHKFEGISLLPILKGNVNLNKRAPLFWAGGRIGKNTGAVRIGDWKLVINHYGEDFLFNIQEDPKETTDLKNKFPKSYSKLKLFFTETLATLPEPVTNRSKLKLN
jgi:arylsulfatase A-like enzyme